MSASRRRPLSATDTSVVLAAILHSDPGIVRECRSRVEDTATAVAHVLAESYARISSMPGRHRLAPSVARQVLTDMFPEPPWTLSGDGYRRVIDLVSELGIPGGSIYDCLIAETARENGVTLVSLDRRAAKHYAAVGVEFVLL